MRKVFLFILVVLLLAVGCSAPPGKSGVPAYRTLRGAANPCFETRFQHIENLGGNPQEVRGYVYDANEEPVSGATVEVYVKGYWDRFHRQALTANDGGFVIADFDGGIDHEYIVRVIGLSDGTAYHAWEETHTFKFESGHDRVVVFIYQVAYDENRCHLPEETQ